MESVEALKYRLSFFQLITGISTEFINLPPNENSEGIERSLRKIGEFIDGDRLALFMFRDGGQFVDMTHEWKRANLPSMMSFFKEILCSQISYTLIRLRQMHDIYIASLDELPPEAEFEKEMLKKFGGKQQGFIPMIYQKQLIGFIFFVVSLDTPINYNDFFSFFRMFGEIVVNAFENKSYIEQIQHLNEDLEQRVLDRTHELALINKELEHYSFYISHDLRAPLRVIKGYTEALREDYGATMQGEALKFFQRIEETALYMGELIDGLLNMSSVTKMELEPRHVHLSNLVKSLTREIERSDIQRKVKWIIQEDVVVFGDNNLLRLVLANLLNNAWKFTKTMTVSVIEFGVSFDDKDPVYFIKDNGVGFDMRYAEKLFKIFQRLHSKEQYEGTGIGLATVKKIILSHHGKIWAESAPGAGAAFYFTLGLTQK